MSTDYKKEQNLVARIIDKNIRRIVAEAVWKGYPPNCHQHRVLDVDGISFIASVPSTGQKTLAVLYQENIGSHTHKCVSEDPSLIAPAKSAIARLQTLTDEMPPITACTDKLSLDNLKKLRQLMQEAIRGQIYIFEMPYEQENPLSPTDTGGSYSLHMAIPSPNDLADLDIAIEVYSSRVSGDSPTVCSIQEMYSIRRALSFLTAIDENSLLVREWGKSITFKGADNYDLHRLKKARAGIFTTEYWEKALGDISLLTVKQQHDLIHNTVTYFKTLPEKLIELETGPVNVCLLTTQGNANDANISCYHQTSILQELKAGKFRTWDKLLPTIKTTFSTTIIGPSMTVDQEERSTDFARFPIFVCLPSPSETGAPLVVLASNAQETYATYIVEFKLFSLLRDWLAGGDRGKEAAEALRGYPIHDLRIPEEYALRATSAIVDKLKEAMSTGDNAPLFRIMQGEVPKKVITKKTLSPAAAAVSTAVKKIAAVLEEKLAGLLPLVEAGDHMNFDIPFEYCGSLNRVSGRVTNFNARYAPPTLCNVTVQFGIVTICLFNATKQESIARRFLADSGISQYIANKANGTQVAEPLCPSLMYALENPEEYISALSKSVDRYVQQRRNSLLSVKEQYYNALSEYFPEDMFEEYCSVDSSTPGM